MAKKDKFYITTAINYPNGEPHIGHAYEAIATDAIARFMRLDGREVFFLTGTDEHGQKMYQTASRMKISAQELADRNSAKFIEMGKKLGIEYDDFIRTSEQRHHIASQDIWRRLEKNGDIYKGTYSGWYSVRDEAYYQEGETEVGDDGVRYGPQDTPVEWVEEESYFFRLSSYRDRLLQLYRDKPDFVGPVDRRNEVISFVKGGLKDLSISRTTFDWGIRVPEVDGHIMYVWVDALTNYLTGVGYPDKKSPLWKFWPANLHIIGKDIVRFHAVYWPAFLLSAGLPLPERVFAHGLLFYNGQKMSKSIGNVIDPFSLVESFGLDQVRYFVLREVPFGQDGNYSREGIVSRINADLANDLGNLAQRSLSMIAKNLQGVVPKPGKFTKEDKVVLDRTDSLHSFCSTAMIRQEIHTILTAIWSVIGDANRYFASQEPWSLKKSDPERMNTVLYVTAEIIRQVAILAQFAMPNSCQRLLDQVGVSEDQRDFANLGEDGRLNPGNILPEPVAVFPRLELEPTTEE